MRQRFNEQGSQGASNGEQVLASQRSFLNERTDLTATEVSPRMTSTVIDKPTGKPVQINTRVIRLSQEKVSFKQLNIKGRQHTSRFKRMVQSFQGDC